MANLAFQVSGATCLVAASSSTASTPTQVSTGYEQGMHIVNASTASLPVYVSAGSSTVQAAAPTTATPAQGLCILAGQAINLWTPPAGWLSAATSGGSASVFATPGYGGA
jgi:hypothetical protein